MFRCEFEDCQTLTTPGQPENKVITSRRTREYTNEIKKPFKRPYLVDSVGWEIVKEMKACPKCFTLHTGKEPTLAKSSGIVFLEQDKKLKPKQEREEERRHWKARKKTYSESSNQRRKPVVQVINPLKVL